jgi:hypothetical protein
MISQRVAARGEKRFSAKKLTAGLSRGLRARRAFGWCRNVEKLRMALENSDRKDSRCGCPYVVRGAAAYAVAPKLTETSFETPGSCIVTP